MRVNKTLNGDADLGSELKASGVVHADLWQIDQVYKSSYRRGPVNTHFCDGIIGTARG